jgi:hypothetical protein
VNRRDSRMESYLAVLFRFRLTNSYQFRILRLSISEMKIKIKLPGTWREGPLTLHANEKTPIYR